MIAVSAASGRLGRAILAALAQRDHSGPVLALARRPDALAGPANPGGYPVQSADYADTEQMTRALQGVTTLVLISAPVKPGSDRLRLHRQAIEAAAAAGVDRVIFTSVIGNGLEQKTAFGPMQKDNRDTERALMDSGMRWVIARNGFYLDLDLMHLRLAAEAGGVYRNNAGTGRCGYVSISELAFATAALALLPERHGEVLNLTGPAVRQDELVAAASRALSLNVRYEVISAAENEARLMAHPMIAQRGRTVAQMLTGCFEAMSQGAFDVESHFESAAGRPPRPLHDQLCSIAGIS